MPESIQHTTEFLEAIASSVGTPFWLIDSREILQRIEQVHALTAGAGLQARYAMKANPATAILQLMQENGIWIDAVSANECFRAIRAGYNPGANPPEILYTADVFRDDWKSAILDHGLLPNLGSPAMVKDLVEAGYTGPVALRINVGFGHGHVNACDTGGPSSKHGIWWEDAAEVAAEAARNGFQVTMLHAHVGSGPRQTELRENLTKLAGFFAEMIPAFPHVNAISLGGGLPHDYRSNESLDIEALGRVLKDARETLNHAAGRELRIEIEPGRYYVVSSATLVATVTDIKKTRTNAKGLGETFVMIDAGFNDLIRPAMYGSYHRISIPAREGDAQEKLCVAGPLCESGDVFTRGADEMLEPRLLPLPEKGDLLCIHDAGAYGIAMSSQYNSIGRPPQVWINPDGSTQIISRRESLETILASECNEALELPVTAGV